MNSSDRTSYESALARARRDLMHSADVAQRSSAESASDDCVQLATEVSRLIADSQSRRGPQNLPKPLAGQIDLEGKEAPPKASAEPKGTPARKRSARAARSSA